MIHLQKFLRYLIRGREEEKKLETELLKTENTNEDDYIKLGNDFCKRINKLIEPVNVSFDTETDINWIAGTKLTMVGGSGSWNRGIDKLLEETILEMYDKLGRKVRCLEVGAGTTYAINYLHFGSPGFVRKMTLKYQDKVEIIVTDVTKDDLRKKEAPVEFISLLHQIIC